MCVEAVQVGGSNFKFMFLNKTYKICFFQRKGSCNKRIFLKLESTMSVWFFISVLSFSATSLANPVPPECTTGQSICFENGDRGLIFVLSPRSRSFEVVCHDSWDKVDADVACKEAGFDRGALEVTTHHDSHGLNFYMDQVDCNGTEQNLIMCKSIQRYDCQRNQAAGAICDSATKQDLSESKERLENCFANKVSFSPADEIGNSTIFATPVQCQRHCARNRNCVQFSYSNITKTCRLYSASTKIPNPYEVGGPPNCTSDGTPPEKLSEGVCQNGTCLIGGKTGGEAEGNVYQEGKAVCDDDWGGDEASVVCRELGYRGLLRFTTGSKFGLVPAPHSGDKHMCEGTEENLLDCTFSSPPGMQCDSGEGAGVICDNRDPAVAAREEVCFNMGVAYHGPPLHESAPQQEVSQADACQSRCNATPNCTHFTWFFLGGKCNLFSFLNILGGYFVFGTVLIVSSEFLQRRAKSRTSLPCLDLPYALWI